MIDFLDKVYSAFTKRNKVQSFSRFFIRRLSNIILPIYLNYSKRKDTHTINISGERIIVSITTFPQRISKIWMVIECILRQSVLPDEIILWLSIVQFPNTYNDLPPRLLNYHKKKLINIRFVEADLRSHKKYYYAFKEFPEDIIITFDDDLFYSSNSIAVLMDLYRRYPNTLCCLRGHKVVKSDGKILPYSQWHKLRREYGPGLDIFHTSGGGTLYKRSMFTEQVLNEDIFKKLCLFADDVWLNVILQLNKTPTIKSRFTTHLIPILNNSFKLSKQNVTEGGNDKQLQALLHYYKIKEKNIFVEDIKKD